MAKRLLDTGLSWTVPGPAPGRAAARIPAAARNLPDPPERVDSGPSRLLLHLIRTLERSQKYRFLNHFQKPQVMLQMVIDNTIRLAIMGFSHEVTEWRWIGHFV